MSSYNTKQRKLLLEYLSAHPDEKLSARHIAVALTDQGISLSAVYRNLAALEKSGMVKRCGISGSREVFYQFICTENCKEHLHLSCKQCGRIFHLNATDSDIFVKKLAENEFFAVDKAQTVVYGICKNCRNCPGNPLED